MTQVIDKPSHARTVASGAPSEKSWTVALRSKSADELEIIVYDIIGSGMFEDGITAKDIIARLRAAPEAKKISLRINSVGGVLNEAKAMVNLLTERASSGVVIEATVDGLAASAASYLLTVANRVVMPANAFQMVHGGRTIAIGTADVMEQRAALLRRENAHMAEAYAAASARRGKSKTKDDFLKAFAAGDTYLDADEAIAWGLADEKLEPIKTAACLADLSALAEAPEALRAAPFVSLAAALVPPAPAHQSPATPALPPVAAIAGSNPEGKKPMKVIALASIAALLGMTAEQQASAEESDILDAIKKTKAKADAPTETSVAISGVKLLGVSTEAEATAKIQQLTRMNSALMAATGASNDAEALARVMTWKGAADREPEHVKQIGDLKASTAASAKEAAIQKLSREGKLAPSMHDWARANFATAEALESFCVALPPMATLGAHEPTDPKQTVKLTAEDREVIAMLGIPENVYLEEKKLEQARKAARSGG